MKAFQRHEVPSDSSSETRDWFWSADDDVVSASRKKNKKKQTNPQNSMKWLNGVFVIQSCGHTLQCYIGIPDDRRNERWTVAILSVTFFNRGINW